VHPRGPDNQNQVRRKGDHHQDRHKQDGFVLKGATADGPDKDLLSVYHNDTGLDAINYKGKQDSEPI
jgi:hypothetical protein